MKKKVLALGFLPYWKGGKQTSGLATGIFDLHDAVNRLDGQYEVVLASTDVSVEEKKVDSTRVIGWNARILIKHSLTRFYKLPSFIINTIVLSVKYKYPFWNTLAKALFLDYSIEKENPVAIHLHGISNAYFYKLLWNKKIPVFLRLHGMNGYNKTVPGYLVYRKKEQDVIKIPFRAVSFISKKNQNDWSHYYGEFSCPTTVVLNGYNSSLFYYNESDALIHKQYDIITIAAIDRNKGQQRVMEAMTQLKEQGVNLAYLIVGTGNKEYVESLKEYAIKNDINVSFVPHCNQDKLRDYLVASKYFIMASAAEGFGKVFIESLACGIPVILPQGLPIVQEGILTSSNSILLEDESSRSIAKSLLKLDSFQLAEAKLVSKSVSSLSWDSSAIQYCDFYLTNGI